MDKKTQERLTRLKRDIDHQKDLVRARPRSSDGPLRKVPGRIYRLVLGLPGLGYLAKVFVAIIDLPNTSKRLDAVEKRIDSIKSLLDSQAGSDENL